MRRNSRKSLERCRAGKNAMYLPALFLVLVMAWVIVLFKADSAGAKTEPFSFSYARSGQSFPLTAELDQGEQYCLTCHSNTGIRITLSSGEKMSLYINPEAYASSTHGDKLSCSDCHVSYSSPPHSPRGITSLRDYTIAQYGICQKCHFANYTKTLDSVHYAVLASGNPNAALCVDCHGEHYVTRAGEPRASISQTCANCHQSIYQTYLGSVHGAALIEENNQDVPVCTDCHGVHNIQDPRTASFRLETPELCGKCHSNKELMQKYGISANVLQSYLQDFHGATVTLVREQASDIWSAKAVCTDCHGIHDIRSITDPESQVIKANLVATCRKCHPEATENFPAAWLSHYETGWSKAPLVYMVRLFYRGFIPFIVVGLALHILLDLWRVATRR